jgi:hypothetical protein
MCFSSCTIFCLFKIFPNYEILKFDLKIILNSMYFGIIIFTCKLKLDFYDDKTLYTVLFHNLSLCWHATDVVRNSHNMEV